MKDERKRHHVAEEEQKAEMARLKEKMREETERLQKEKEAELVAERLEQKKMR